MSMPMCPSDASRDMSGHMFIHMSNHVGVYREGDGKDFARPWILRYPGLSWTERLLNCCAEPPFPLPPLPNDIFSAITQTTIHCSLTLLTNMSTRTHRVSTHLH